MRVLGYAARRAMRVRETTLKMEEALMPKLSMFFVTWRRGRGLLCQPPRFRRGNTQAQTAVILVLIAVGVIAGVRMLGTNVSNDVAVTATGVGNPASLVGRFGNSGSSSSSSGSSGSSSGSGGSGSSGSGGSGSDSGGYGGSDSGSGGSGDSGSGEVVLATVATAVRAVAADFVRNVASVHLLLRDPTDAAHRRHDRRFGWACLPWDFSRCMRPVKYRRALRRISSGRATWPICVWAWG